MSESSEIVSSVIVEDDTYVEMGVLEVELARVGNQAEKVHIVRYSYIEKYEDIGNIFEQREIRNRV